MCVLEEDKKPEGEAEGGASESGITLDENGDLNIPDSFWGDAENTPGEPGESPKEPTNVAEDGAEEPHQPQTYYTPEEAAGAIAAGEVDPSRLAPEVIDYYKAIDELARRNEDARRVQREMIERQAQAGVPPQQPQTVSWEQYLEASKQLAAREYLGINPDDFDEFDPRHSAARTMAMQEIRDKAQEMMRAQEAQQRRAADVTAVYTSYLREVPEFNVIGEQYFPVWRENLTVREAGAVNEILASGDTLRLRKLFDKITADYRASKEASAPAAPAAGKTAPPPPPVMRASGGAESAGAGMVDAAAFGQLTPEEQAKFLIDNKFIG